MNFLLIIYLIANEYLGLSKKTIIFVFLKSIPKIYDDFCENSHFYKIHGKIGGSIEVKISARWPKFFTPSNLPIYMCIVPPSIVFTQGDIRYSKMCSFIVNTFFFWCFCTIFSKLRVLNSDKKVTYDRPVSSKIQIKNFLDRLENRLGYSM